MRVISRLFALRHVERQKDNTTDPQAPTLGGEVVAYAMGAVVREQYRPMIEIITSSPADRAVYTAAVLMHGICGYKGTSGIPIDTDHRLGDWSSDPRHLIQRGLESAKIYAAIHGIEVEAAVFETAEGRSALDLKLSEGLAVINELAAMPGDHLVAGLHGGSVDGLYMTLKGQMTNKYIEHLGQIGGLLGKCEGFVASFDENGELVGLEQIRQPPYLKTLATVLK